MTVQDQIRLWELEKNRVKSQEGRFAAILSQLRHRTRGLMARPLQAICIPLLRRKPTTSTS